MLHEISTAVQAGFPLLSIIIFLPAIAALITMKINDNAALRVAYIVSLAELALAVVIWLIHDPTSASMQLTETSKLMGLNYALGVDGISTMFLPTTALLTLFAVVYTSKSVDSNIGGYLSALLFSEAALMGAFTATDLSLFWIFFVAEIIPSYFLIKVWGTGEKRNTIALNYLMYMALAAFCIGAGFILIAINLNGDTNFDLVTIMAGKVDPTFQTLIFFVMCIGFAIKAPMFPLHSWLPKVLEHGPLVGMSVFLVGIKLGAYGLIRFTIPLLPDATKEWFWLMAVFGVLSMLYGALIALNQTNLRRLMAFASISHMGVITLGLFSLNIAGIEGGLLQALNLGITGAGLFLIASFLSLRIGTPDLRNMGGLQGSAPYMALGFLIIALAAVGMPGTSGFNGEHLVLLGAFERHWFMALCVGVGPILSAAYFLRYYQQAFLGQTNKDCQDQLSDIDGRERFILLSLVGVVLWIGLYTTPFLSTLRGSVEIISSKFNTIEKMHGQEISTGMIQGEHKLNFIDPSKMQ